MNDEIVTVSLTFRIDDHDLLLRLAEDTIERNGMGHPFDPGNLADCIIELLLHSNPDIKGYLDYGIELLHTNADNGDRTVSHPPATLET